MRLVIRLAWSALALGLSLTQRRKQMYRKRDTEPGRIELMGFLIAVVGGLAVLA